MYYLCTTSNFIEGEIAQELYKSLSENEDAVLISWQINEFYICMYG